MARRRSGVSAILGGLAIALPGHPAEAAQSKCLTKKNKCVASTLTSLLKCHQKAETPGKPADPNAKECVDKAQVTIVSSRPDFTSIRFLLDYPAGRVALPGGVGPDVPTGTFTDGPGDVGPFDLEHAVRVVVSAPFTFDTTTIAHVNFLGCAEAAPPNASDYRCIVIDAADGSFTNVGGVTCSVTMS